MFIVFEGADACGKTTQSETLLDALRNHPALRGREIIRTREPGGSPGAEDIRKLILSGDAGRWSPETELLLFNAARRDHVERTIKPALKRGAIVICDRFVGSTIAYQGARSPQLARKAELIHREMIGLSPDLTILLDRPAPDARAHLDARGKDRMEKVQAAFMDRTKGEFSRMLAEDETWRGVFVADKDLAAQAILGYVLAEMGIPSDKPSRRTVMDEGYLARLGEVHEYLGGTASLFSGFGVDDIRFGSEDDPAAYCPEVRVITDRQGLIESMDFTISGVPTSFIGITEDGAQAHVLSRIESDIPELMAQLSGYEPESFGM